MFSAWVGVVLINHKGVGFMIGKRESRKSVGVGLEEEE